VFGEKDLVGFLFACVLWASSSQKKRQGCFAAKDHCNGGNPNGL
jgi:hypothetical protein